jgi:hypothetical protein
MTAQASKKTLKQALDTYYQAMATYQQQGAARKMRRCGCVHPLRVKRKPD